MLIRRLIREMLLAEEGVGSVGTAAAAIFNDEGKVLIVRRSATAPWRPLHWSLPGGVVDGTETTRDAAQREAEEEVSLFIDSLHSLGVVISDEGWSIEYFYSGPGEWSGEVTLQETDGILENDKFRWVSLDELADYPLVPTLLEGIIRAVKMRDRVMSTL